MHLRAHKPGQALPLPEPEQLPGTLQHLARLSETFTHEAHDIPFLHIYARHRRRAKLRPLEFITARESGPEGIACVDDVARAALLALAVYEATPSKAVLTMACAWLDFVIYMQEPDGRFVNFICDRSGRKNGRGRTSYVGGQWWSSRALWALAAAWRVTGDERYLQRFMHGRMAPVRDLKITAVQALALLELYRARPTHALRVRICALCDRILRHSPDYLRDREGLETIKPWGYHQLQALARAGRLFHRVDYLEACERTVQAVIEPLVASAFTHIAPWDRAPQCAYDISTLVLGLEELHAATHKRRYRELALACASWIYEANPSGEALYDPATGCCADGLADDGRSLNANCGAESAIEAGFVELARRRLLAGRAARPLVASLAAVLG